MDFVKCRVSSRKAVKPYHQEILKALALLILLTSESNLPEVESRTRASVLQPCICRILQNHRRRSFGLIRTTLSFVVLQPGRKTLILHRMSGFKAGARFMQQTFAADCIPPGDNIVYTLHFYAGTHHQYLRDKAIKAVEMGVALQLVSRNVRSAQGAKFMVLFALCLCSLALAARRLVSEWGTCEANGNGHLDLEEAQKWEDLMAGDPGL